MSNRLRKAMNSAGTAMLLMVLLIWGLSNDLHISPSFLGWVAVGGLVGFLSQYYLWGRNDE